NVRTREVRDVVALHTQRGICHTQRLLDVGQRLGARNKITAAASLVQHESVLCVCLDRLCQARELAALGNLKDDLSRLAGGLPPPTSEPELEFRGVVGESRNDDATRGFAVVSVGVLNCSPDKCRT